MTGPDTMSGDDDGRSWCDPTLLPASRFDLRAPLPTLEELGPVHFIAIGGIGMSGVARLMLEAGLTVTGSDQRDGSVIAGLRAAGATVTIGHDAALVDGVGTVVVSTAIPETNVELARARALGIRVLHRAQALQCLIADRRVIAVAGANGKTSTTSLIAWGLVELGHDPTYAIGGELLGASNARLGAGPVAVIEADESDHSFLAYHPSVAVVTSVQPDHLDHYSTFEAIETAYRCFLAGGVPDLTAVVNIDDAGSRDLADDARAEAVAVVGYGHAPDAAWHIVDEELRPDGSTALLRGAQTDVRLGLGVPGARNVENATAALAAIVAATGDDPQRVARALASFRGTGRRFERRGSAAGGGGVVDYAHNPAKVASVVETGRAVVGPGGRLVVVFQPHLYSRTRDFQREFGEALAGADVVVVTDVYGAREEPEPGVTGRLVAEAATASGAPDVRYVESLADVPAKVVPLLHTGDVVLTVGAGDVTTVGPRLLELLGEAQP